MKGQMMDNQLFAMPESYRDEFGRVHEHVQETPYAGTSGWTGSDTSRDRAANADTTGQTGKRQGEILDMLADADTLGLTYTDIDVETGWGHGTVSGALSVLHKTGHIARLKETRNSCHVYVLPSNVLGRQTEQPGRTSAVKKVEQLHQLLLTHDLPAKSRQAIEQFQKENAKTQ